MRRRLGSWGLLAVLGLAIWGCGPPQVVPMTPPGVTFQRVSTDQMEALGEVQSRGTVQPAGVAPGRPGTSSTSEPMPGAPKAPAGTAK